MTSFHLQIVTPDGCAYDGPAEYVSLRTINGCVGICPHHTDYVTALGMGEARVVTDGETRRAACIGGMLAVTKGDVKVVATTFEWADQIDVERAKASLARAETMLSDPNADEQTRTYALARQKRARVRLSVAEKVDRVQAAADAVARLDALCSLAETAVRNNYTMPEVDTSRELQIIQGRHPVVEQAMKDVLFVPNDTYLNDSDDRAAIVTGPNMAGKSTYMRQTALIVLMAQIGSFVPAKSATIGIVDRVFTRIGASDDLASGQSTFMVEMSEMASILKHATAASLLILDEIGRGTSTFDGMAIARAVLEYCADKRKLGAKTMFATHYHELSALEGEIQGVRNYSISAKKQGGDLVFLRKIVRGAADDSYGIEVAKLAGLPEAVISKAKGYLKELEADGISALPRADAADDGQISFADVGTDEIRQMLESADLNTLTPIEAMNLLFELQKKARG